MSRKYHPQRLLLPLVFTAFLAAGCSVPEYPEIPTPDAPAGAPSSVPPKSTWTVTASDVQEELYRAEYACDGKMDTRWSSPPVDPSWLQIDLGAPADVCGLTIHWEAAFASEYAIELSLDAKTWNTVYKTTRGDGNTDDLYFILTRARFIRILGTRRATGWGHSIWEVEVKGSDEMPLVDAPTGPRTHDTELFDGDLSTLWKSDKAAPFRMDIDLRVQKGLGGVRIDWGDVFAAEAQLLVSTDGASWEDAAALVDGVGTFDVLMHPRKEARFIRLEFSSSSGDQPVEIREISLRGPDEVATPLALYQLAAIKARPGLYPPHLLKRQTYWTLVGIPNDGEESLLDEYGNLEPKAGSGSLMPYVFENGQLLSAFDAREVTQALEDDYLPLPSVHWEMDDLRLDIQAIARGTPSDSATYARYQLSNLSAETRTGRFFLVVRPVQVNPAWQFGGLSSITNLSLQRVPAGWAVRVNSEEQYISFTEPDAFGVQAFERGDIVRELARGQMPVETALSGAGDYLSGVLAYDYHLAPNESISIVVAAPLHESTIDVQSFSSTGQERTVSPNEAFDHHLRILRAKWRKKLNRVRIELPQDDVVETMKSQVGYILINADGVSIQPGSRNYKRAWIRDGSLTGAAMLRMGLVDEVRDYIEWYSRQVQPNGWVPPILGNDGEIHHGFGWDNEYDSQGEYIFAVMEYYRFTHDTEFLARHFGQILRSMQYMIELRNKTLEPGYMSDHPAPERFTGILPASISHEGYNPPMHSYWDDFWALKGWKDGAEAARILGRDSIAAWADEQYGIFRASMQASVEKVIEYKQIDHVPGCAEKGDCDPTSTAIGLFPCDEGDLFPYELYERTFDKYYQDLLGRSDPDWVGGFTPYEVRSMLAFVYLGQNDRAKQLLDYMLTCRRPPAWNHLAEVVHSDPRLPVYIGDMPHTWVGSGYVNSIRGLMVMEKNGSLVLLPGVPEEWVSETGLLLENLPTHFGSLDLIAQQDGNRLDVHIGGSLDVPNGIELHWPSGTSPAQVTVDGEAWSDYDEKSCRLPGGAQDIVATW